MVDDLQTDGLSDLMSAMAIKKAGWFRHQNSETGATAYFPATMDQKDSGKIAEWEVRTRDMHAAQVAIMPAKKPLESSFTDRRTTRGD